MTNQEMIDVIGAYRDGQSIQLKRKVEDGSSRWHDCVGDKALQFNFDWYSYRVKPEPPKPRKWFVRLDRHTGEGWAYLDRFNATSCSGLPYEQCRFIPVEVQEVL